MVEVGKVLVECGRIMDMTQLKKVLKEKRKTILIISLILVATFAYILVGKYTAANPDTLYKIVQAEQRDLVKSISVSGEMVSESEVELASDASGQLTAIYVEIGQSVKKGEIIANVENRTQRAQVTQVLGALQAARAQVLSAEAQLQKVLNGSSQEDKNIVASQVSAAESGLTSAQDTARNALQSAYAGTVSAISFGTDVALQDTSSANPTLKFQTTEYSAKITTENKRVVVEDILIRHNGQSAYTLGVSELTSELQTTKDDLIVLRELTDSLLVTIGGAITTASVTESTVSSYTTSVSTARTQILANITALTSAQSAITSADKALHTVQENEGKVLTGARTEDIDAAKAGVSAAEASVLSASGNYMVAKAVLDKTYIYSPQSGKVVDIYKEVGEFVSSSVKVVKVSSISKHVSALVSEIDIAKVSVGNDVAIELDAFVGQQFTGTIDFIYPDKQEVMGIVYFELKVSFNEAEIAELTILPGMSLDVVIPYETKESVLSVERSITKKDGSEYFVQILNPNKKKPIDQKFVNKFFEAGFVGDKYIEILSGLQDSEELVKFTMVEDADKK